MSPDPDNELVQFETPSNYLFIFMIVGLITLFPLVILTAVITFKASMPKTCRFICLCATLTLASAVAAMLLLYFALGPQDMQLTRGDQILQGNPNHGYLMGTDRVRAWACNSLTIHTDRLGVMVWAISVSPNLGPAENYSLSLLNWTLPAQLRFRLNRGDQFSVRNNTGPINVVVLKGDEAWKKWKAAGVYQPGYEKCCAWSVIEPNSSDPKMLQVDSDDIFTVVIREERGATFNALGEQPEAIQLSGAIDFHRVRLLPTPCDPIVCDGTVTKCLTQTTPERYVIDYGLQPASAPLFDMVNVRIVCHPRHWALGIVFSIVPLLVVSITLAVWRYRVKRVKQMEFFDNVLDRNPKLNIHSEKLYENEQREGHNPAFELDLV